MRALGLFLICWALLLGGPGSVSAASLTAAEQTMLTELLGAGVVGEAVTASALTPRFLPLEAGTWTYQIASGGQKGQSERHVVKRLENDPSGANWRYTAGDLGDVLIKQAEDGSLTIVSEQDNAQSVITRYQPAEPGLLVGLAPGDSRSASIAVAVSDLSSPHVASHKGTLEVTYSHLCAYKVTTPAGTHDAALIKWAYKGKVGPADVDDTQYRFFAENVGMVATVDKLSVAALFVYHEHTKSGKVLAGVSARGQGAPGSAAR